MPLASRVKPLMPMPDDHQIDDQQKTRPPKTSKDAGLGRVTFKAEHSLSYNSPIAPPEIIEGYARVLPSAPERILAMVERQEAHRHHIEKTVVEAGAKNASKAINVTAYIATLFVGAAVYMVHEHYVVYGIVTIGSTLAALAGVNIYGRTTQKNERIEKKKILTEDDNSRQRRRRLSGGEAQQEIDEDDGQQTFDGMN